jgi:hypothetical protein
MKKNIIFLIFVISYNSFGQFGNLYKSVLKTNTSSLFNIVKGDFVSTERKSSIVDGKIQKTITGYKFDRIIDLQFYYPKTKEDSSCSYFVFNRQKIKMVGRFENDFACDLDVTSFQVFEGYFNRKKYILLTSINSGSGSFATTIIFHLFDITKKDKVIYYPLWSRYGSIKCLGDFNKDGILDFLKIRNNEKYSGSNTFKGSLMSLDKLHNSFRDIPNGKEWIFERTYTKDSNINFKLKQPSN